MESNLRHDAASPRSCSRDKHCTKCTYAPRTCRMRRLSFTASALKVQGLQEEIGERRWRAVGDMMPPPREAVAQKDILQYGPMRPSPEECAGLSLPAHSKAFKRKS